MQARPVEVIDLDNLESPQQHSGFREDASLRLPDLTEILNNLDQSRNPVAANPPSKSEEVREFGDHITKYSFLQHDGSIVQPLSKKVAEARVPKSAEGSSVLKTRKPRVAKPKAPKEITAKVLRKKPLTITERAVAPFLKSSTITKSTAAERTILDFLDPGATTICTARRSTVHTTKPAARRKRKSKEDPVIQLDSPKTARRKHAKQCLQFAALKEDSIATEYMMNPSKLISLSKNHFHAGSRCAEGKLTDGGPSECPSNQEALFSKDDEFLDLTMLPSTRHIDVNSENDEATCSKHIESPQSEADSPSPLGAEQGSCVLQDYLRDLVECSDTDFGSKEFPVTSDRVPENTRADTVESLRDLLEESALPTEKHDAPRSPNDVSTSGKREPSTSSRGTKTSPRSREKSSSKSADYITLDSDNGNLEEDAPRLLFVNEVTSTDFRHTSTQEISIEVVCINDSSSVTTSQKAEEPGSKRGAPRSPRIGPRPEPCQIRLESDIEDYWIVPDSEDDEADFLHRSSPKDIGPKAPKFDGYTTAQLQTELDRFGFKPSKNRAGMVNLLHKCWAAKTAATPTIESGSVLDLTIPPNVSTTTQNAGTSDHAIPEPAVKQSIAVAPKRVGLTAEEKTAKRIATAEKKAALALEKAALKLAAAEDKKATKLADKKAAEVAKTEAAKTLYTTLTTLLRSRAGNIWAARIMKYEPIVLEDFTHWLQVSFAITAEADIVRDYFDMKGICCVYKLTRFGRDRKRF